MKTIKSLCLAILAFTTLSSAAQTADEIVAKNVAAMGGLEKLKTLKSIKLEGSLSTQGYDIPITITKLKDKGLRLDADVMGTANYQVANTTKGSIYMPAMGMSEPQDMGAVEYSMAKDQMNLVGTLASYKENGAKLEYLGIEEAGGVPAHKVKLTKANGNVVTYFLDQKTYFVSKISSTHDVDGTPTETATNFRDYKQNDQGYWFPYVQSTPNGDITFTTISTNIAIDEKIFQP